MTVFTPTKIIIGSGIALYLLYNVLSNSDVDTKAVGKDLIKDGISLSKKGGELVEGLVEQGKEEYKEMFSGASGQSSNGAANNNSSVCDTQRHKDIEAIVGNDGLLTLTDEDKGIYFSCK